MSKRLMRRVLTVGLLVLLVSCGGGGGGFGALLPGPQQNQQQDHDAVIEDPVATPPPAWPAFPVDEGVRGTARSDYPVVVSNNELLNLNPGMRYGRIEPHATEVYLDSETQEAVLPNNGPNKLVWAIYRMDNAHSDGLRFLEMTGGTVQAGASYYILLADWFLEEWEVFSFTQDNMGRGADEGLDFEDLDGQYISPGGSFYWCVAVFPDVELRILNWTVSGDDDQPVAVISADPATGHAPLDVSLDASQSYQTKGSINNYEWDLDGDAEFNEPGQEEQALGESSTSYTYERHGSPTGGDEYHPAVRITDNFGAIDIGSTTITVTNTLPLANLQADIIAGAPGMTVGFDASNSIDPDGSISKYEFDFDEGAGWSDNGADPTASYTYNNSGQFTAEVRVTDDDGNVNDPSQTEPPRSLLITVWFAPVADLQVAPAVGEPPLMVTLDAAGTTDQDSTDLTYEFDFGEGDGWEPGTTSATTQHEYTNADAYTVLVRVTDDTGLTDTAQTDLLVNHSPEAALSADPTYGIPPLSVTLDASGSTDQDGPIASFEWDWDGDGTIDHNSGTMSEITHVYSDPGIYDTIVTVTDSLDATDTATVQVIASALPVAALSAIPQFGDFPLTVDFDASASADADDGGSPGAGIVKYEFDFGEGGGWQDYGTTSTAQHTYNVLGLYTAQVRVTDNEGDTDTVSIEVGGDQAICYVAQEDTQWGIYVMNSDGSGQTNLVNTTGASFSGISWSPDKSRIAVSIGSPYYIWVLNADGTGLTQITTEESYYPYWIDNEYLLFSTVATQREIKRIRYDGTDVSTLTSTTDGLSDMEPYLSPDGKRVVFSRDKIQVFVADFPSFNNAMLVGDVGGSNDRYPCWSVSDEIAWSSSSSKTIYKVNSDGTGQAQISPGSEEQLQQRFSPDGTKLVFTREDTTNNIGVMNSDGTNSQVLTNYSQGAVNPAWDTTRWPKAELEVTSGDSGPFPRTIGFDASDSYDMDNGTGAGLGIVQYDWDWDSDGSFEVINGSATPSHTLSTAGYYQVTVRVTDDECETNTAVIGVGDARGDWYMFGREETHSRLSPFVGPETISVPLWTYSTGDNIRASSPTIDSDGTIYVGSYDNKLHAVYPGGSEKWTYTTGGDVLSSPTVGIDGTVYVGSHDNKLHAINPDGSGKWTFTTGDDVRSSPVIAEDGTIYIGSSDKKLYAINHDGSFKWSYTTGGLVVSSPAIGTDGTIYVGCNDSNLYAINPDGSFKWAFPTGSSIGYCSPSIGTGGTIYIGSNDGYLYAINSAGSQVWNYNIGSNIESSPGIGADGTIYVSAYLDDELFAINPDGSFKWSYVMEGDSDSSPTIDASGTIYVGSYDKKLYALNPDGTLKWSYTTGGSVWSSPAIGADGTVYFGSFDGNLYAFGPGNGPVADLTGSPLTGSFPLTVDFDASGSFDPNGNIASFDYDWDNDGTWDLTNGGATPSHTYTNWGVYRAVVRVTDNDGQQDTAYFDINADFTWNTHVVGEMGIGCQKATIASIGGVPTILYCLYPVVSRMEMWFAKANSSVPSSTADWAKHAIKAQAGHFYGSQSRMIELNGVPVICYNSDNGAGDSDLMYGVASSSDPTSSTDWTSHLLNNTTDRTGFSCWLIAINGKPAISYFNIDLANLAFAQANTSIPTSPGDWSFHYPATNGSGAGATNYTAMEVLGGYPAVAYYDSTNADLRFALATTATPSSSTDWNIHAVAEIGNVGKYASLAILNGKPMISYFDDTNNKMMLACSTTSTPTATGDWDKHIVDPSTYTGEHSAISNLNGRPVITYQDGDASTKDLMCAFAMTPTPSLSTDWVLFRIDTSGDVGRYTNMVVINNQPYIVYGNETATDLKFARPN